jgi:hypothetical protein
MICKLPIANARLTPLAAKTVYHSDAFWGLLKHCNAYWNHLSKEERRRNFLALQRGEEVRTPFTDRNGVRFVVVTDAKRTETILKLEDEP